MTPSVDASSMSSGHPDPATALLDQVHHDPDGDSLSGLMTEWYAAFGSVATTVRKAVKTATSNRPNLHDAIREFPVEERSGGIKPPMGPAGPSQSRPHGW